MTGHAVDVGLNFGDIRRIHYVLHRMAKQRMPKSILNGQNDDLVLLVVIRRQLDAAIEDGQDVLGFHFLRPRVRTVALQAQRASLRAQQVLIVAAVRFVTGSTTQSKHRLMQMRLLKLVSLFAVACQASIDGIGLNETGRLAGMRIVAGNAFALRARMLNFRLFDLLAFVAVAGQA